MPDSKRWGCVAAVAIVLGLVTLFFDIRDGADWSVIASICIILSGLAFYVRAAREWQQSLLYMGLGLGWIYSGLGDKPGVHKVVNILTGAIVFIGSIVLAMMLIKGDKPSTNENEDVVSSGTDN